MLTMYDAEATLIRLLQMGLKGFLKKDIHPNELKLALETVMQVGYYYSYDTTGRILNLFRNMNDQALQRNLLSDQEVEFLKLAASDKTYKEIASELNITTSQFALAWCLKNKHVSTAITGATQTEQLRENILAIDVLEKITDEVMNETEKIISSLEPTDAHKIILVNGIPVSISNEIESEISVLTLKDAKEKFSETI